jgi:putative DNA primase/helicase
MKQFMDQPFVNRLTLGAIDLVRNVCRHAALKAASPKTAVKLAAASTMSGVERLARADRRHAGN